VSPDLHSFPTRRSSDLSCVQEIVLKWNSYINWPGGVDSYVIYRSENGGSESFFETVSGSTTSYTDTLIQYGNYYKYRIEAIENRSEEHTSELQSRGQLV